MTSTYKETILSIIFIVYLFFAVTWLCPESRLRSNLLEPVKQFWLFWGLDQNWRLFSPEIRKINFHSESILTMHDGSRLMVTLPRMEQLNYIDRFRLEKFRKWSIDSLPWPDYKLFWPDFARYIGKKYYDPQNPPQSLSLNLYWIEIPPPDLRHITAAAALPGHTKMSTVFFYQYKESDRP